MVKIVGFLKTGHGIIKTRNYVVIYMLTSFDMEFMNQTIVKNSDFYS